MDIMTKYEEHFIQNTPLYMLLYHIRKTDFNITTGNKEYMARKQMEYIERINESQDKLNKFLERAKEAKKRVREKRRRNADRHTLT